MALPRPIPDAVVDLVARRLEVVAQPQRIKLVDALDRGGETTVNALADAVGVTLYNASQHLAVLRRAGIVRRRREGRMAWYALADPTVIALYEQVAEALAAELRRLGRQLDQDGDA